MKNEKEIRYADLFGGVGGFRLGIERLQGFPDNWTEGVSDTQRYIQMGNAVTVNVIEAIMRNIN